jgi:formylglycine-generating enzyme required for sulfatase activity
VSRGGSWGDLADYCRVAKRYFNDPSYAYIYLIGFRVARSSVP